MNILLDTHALIWFFDDDKRLSKTAREAIFAPDNMIYVSIASLWEIGIKLSTGKLNSDAGLDGFIEAVDKNGFAPLAISPDHIKVVTELPFIHRDPFDRILIAQAKVENMTIMTVDENIRAYDVPCIW